MGPTRVLAVLHLAGVSGPARSLRPWLERVTDGGELELAVPAGGDGGAAAVYGPSAKVTELPYEALVLPRSPADAARLAAAARRRTRALRGHLRARRPDLVVVATATLPWALAAARLERVPAIAYVGEIVPTGPDPLRAAGGRAVVTATRRLAAAVVCCSEAAAAPFGGPGAVEVIAPGIEPPRGGDGDRFRREHGLAGADPLLLVVGNLSRQRGQDVAIEALAQVRRRLPRAGLALAGAAHPRPADRAYAAELRALAARLGVGEAVAFAGAVADMASAYAAADVVVNPIRAAEGLGRAALEALAAGRPVVASAVPGVTEALAGGRAGLLVEPGDPAALAAAVLRLAGDRAERERIVRAGGDHVRAAYAVERGAAAFAAVAAEALSE
ncbi:MAG: glycosyltransferase family 4 protein [Solirubrobacterales bacterium]|nr:glycosyltransferase family 4 protein [Solirubrobacterales bacterium]